MKYFNEKARTIWRKYIVENYFRIKVESGECRYNFQCHRNSVHEAIKNKDKKIAVCFYFDEDYPVLHFINYSKSTYIDNTLGKWSEYKEFYFVRWIRKEEFFSDTLFIFDRLIEKYNKMIPWWWRWLVNCRV